MLDFQNLDVYRCANEFLAVAYGIVREAERGHGPELDQLRRAATSVPLSIAEGCGRTGAADKARSFAIARGSAMECAAMLDGLAIAGVVEPEVHRHGRELLQRIVSMLTRLCR